MDAVRLDIHHPLRGFALAISLAFGRETVALAGPSGAGKTSVLRAVAGLLTPERGTVEVGGRRWYDAAAGIDVPPERRSVGLVFQDYALFPHLTAAANVAYGSRRPVGELLARFGLAELAGVRPGHLSGGEQQRVALARALAREPEVLLLDEPLGALDAHTRRRLRGQLREHLRGARLPTLLVTHDFAEAAALADRIAVMVAGRVVQTGTAAELLARPASAFVAEFAGGNVLLGRARPVPNGLTEVVLEAGPLITSTDPADGEVAVVVYPWEIALARRLPEDSSLNHVEDAIATVIPLGNRVRVRVGPLTAEVTAASADRLGLREGETVVASFKATGTRLLPV